MTRTILISASSAAIAFLAAMSMNTGPRAADEIRCRVNAEALLRDLAELSRPNDDEIIKLLRPKP